MKSMDDELLVDITELVEDLLLMLKQSLGAYGYGLSNETHDRAMEILGRLDAIRIERSTDLPRMDIV